MPINATSNYAGVSAAALAGTVSADVQLRQVLARLNARVGEHESQLPHSLLPHVSSHVAGYVFYTAR